MSFWAELLQSTARQYGFLHTNSASLFSPPAPPWLKYGEEGQRPFAKGEDKEIELSAKSKLTKWVEQVLCSSEKGRGKKFEGRDGAQLLCYSSLIGGYGRKSPRRKFLLSKLWYRGIGAPVHLGLSTKYQHFLRVSTRHQTADQQNINNSSTSKQKNINLLSTPLVTKC